MKYSTDEGMMCPTCDALLQGVGLETVATDEPFCVWVCRRCAGIEPDEILSSLSITTMVERRTYKLR